MNPILPTYESLRDAILAAHGPNLNATLLQNDCLQALVELGIVVRVGDGLIAATSHGERIHRRLKRGEHIAELDPPPDRPVEWST
jgi:hypothetical protein